MDDLYTVLDELEKDGFGRAGVMAVQRIGQSLTLVEDMAKADLPPLKAEVAAFFQRAKAIAALK